MRQKVKDVQVSPGQFVFFRSVLDAIMSELFKLKPSQVTRTVLVC